MKRLSQVKTVSWWPVPLMMVVSGLLGWLCFGALSSAVFVLLFGAFGAFAVWWNASRLFELHQSRDFIVFRVRGSEFETTWSNIRGSEIVSAGEDSWVVRFDLADPVGGQLCFYVPFEPHGEINDFELWLSGLRGQVRNER